MEKSLIERCIRKEPKAQYELYRALHHMMMGICTRYERNKQDAVATMNAGFLKILERIGERRPEVPFDAWARRIMINTVIDAFRRNKERKATETHDGPLESSDQADANDYLKNMEAEAFAELLLRLPPMSRSVFNLFAVDGYSHAEIATMLGMSEGTSKWHVNHARGILQRAILEVAHSRSATLAVK
ncbi:MAG: RNA polymerase sigma factor [Flavobacteriales bacterium]|nr:MAG: RNA polymerase sigma factor [Flavobacteriales bacterium]